MNPLQPSAASIAMATYNGVRFLEEQIQSVRLQMQSGDELVVVDDASTDGTMKLLEQLQFPRMRVYQNPKNLGAARTFDRALSLTRNHIVFLCDQDDVWLPGKREAFVESFLRDKRCSVVVSDAELIDAAGRTLAASFMQTRGGFSGSLWSTLYKNRFLGCCMALRRDVLSIGLPIPPTVPQHDMWLGLLGAEIGTVHYLSTAYLRYRRHEENTSPSRPASTPTMVRWRASLLLSTRRRLWQRRALRAGGPGRG
jgi:glycosyltransferase involved in cell wall biosynthesis